MQPGAGRNVSVFVFDEPFLFLLFFLFFFLSFWSSTLVSVHITRYAEYLQFSSLSKRYVKGKHASVSGFFFLFFSREVSLSLAEGVSRSVGVSSGYTEVDCTGGTRSTRGIFNRSRIVRLC